MAYRSPAYWAVCYFAPPYFASAAGSPVAGPIQPDWRFATVTTFAGDVPDPAYSRAVLS